MNPLLVLRGCSSGPLERRGPVTEIALLRAPRRRCALFRGSVLSVLLAGAFCLAAAAESTDWRLGVAAWSFNRFTLFEAVDKTASIGVQCLEAFEGQRLRPDRDDTLNLELPDAMIDGLRAKLDAAAVRLTSIYIHNLPAEEAACRRYFEFGRKLGLEFIVSEPAPEALDVIDTLCAEFDLRVALHNHPEGSSRYWHPREVLEALEGRSARLGACGDVGHWVRSGLDPVDAVVLLGPRLMSLHVKDLHQASRDGHDVPWGTGRSDIGGLLEAVARLDLRPRLFTIEYEHNWDQSLPEIAACAEFFHRTTAQLRRRQPAVDNAGAEAGRLWAGWASIDITPTRPVALIGQLHKRISKGVRDPLTATALALETRNRPGKSEQAILVSCDVIFTLKAVQERIRARVREQLPGFDADKLFLNATHTHTAPGMVESTFCGLYDVSQDPGVMTADEYGAWFVERIVQVALEAWSQRQPAGMSWGLGHAVVGYNRRAHYFDGSSVMYGGTDTANFARPEGIEDHAVDVLCFWDASQELTGLVINLACPSQETEQLELVSADFWHDIRQEIRRRHRRDLFVLPQCATSGDQSPHPIWRKEAERVMADRRGVDRRQDIARRVANAVDEVLAVAQDHLELEPVFRHLVAHVDLPEDPDREKPFYETDSVHPIEFHVIRLGDVAIATNPFELFLDYGIRIEARSRATLTLTVQLACQHSGYLPTSEGVRGGGYSADKFVVGPEGGQVLVEETVQRINALWP